MKMVLKPLEVHLIISKIEELTSIEQISAMPKKESNYGAVEGVVFYDGTPGASEEAKEEAAKLDPVRDQMSHYSAALEDETDISTFLFRAINNKDSFLERQKRLL